MNPFFVPFATTNMGSAILAMDLVLYMILLFILFHYIPCFLTTEIDFHMQGWMGPNYSISTACATSNFCILNAANHIRKGEAVSNFIFLPVI
jgi:3-oxoacyl-[acyl-carrier-protein] synthase II